MQESKTVFITGETSGIGLSLAVKLLESGYNVYGLSRRTDPPVSLTRYSDNYSHFSGDVSNVCDVDKAVTDAIEKFGDINCLVNSAGINGGGRLTEIDDKLWESVLGTNLNGVFYTTRSVLSHSKMIDRQWGRIISVASTAGKQGVLFASPYCASKHGVVGFSKSIAQELASKNITINAVCPGYVETPMAEKVRKGHARYWNTSEADILAQFEKKIPLGRYSTPDEVASLILYLLGSEAGSITAQAINVCGGLGRY